MSEVVYSPIGYFKCENSKKYAAPRQAVLADKGEGVICLSEPINQDCINDLVGFDRVWLIYDFHCNEGWKAKVRPPRGSSTKRSVFSTRSPYRPNSIGMSCVKLNKIDGLKILVSEFDLLDGTPILDIKPYLPYADSFKDSAIGWVAEQEESKFAVKFSESSKEKVSWLGTKLDLDLMGIIRSQLEYEPTSKKAKRVKPNIDGFVFSIQAWRILFSIEGDVVKIADVYSGYTPKELTGKSLPEDEKILHYSFLKSFAQ